jgi:hypothetical protein
MKSKSLISEIHSLKNPEKIDIYQGFFKTGKGEYGEGDVFLGLTVPQTRGLVKKYAPTMTLEDVDVLLADIHHEVRLAGVLILVYFAQKKKYPVKELARFYMQHVSGINNWDLIDTSSEHIIGPYIQHESDTRRTSRFYHAMYSQFQSLDQSHHRPRFISPDKTRQWKTHHLYS